MAQDRVDQVTAARKAAFVRTMMKHPERLKGKSIEEAYQGMRRQVGHMTEASGGNRNSPNFIGPTYNGQAAATAGGSKKVPTKAVGSDLLGGKNAKMGPVSQGAVERRLNKDGKQKAKNYGDKVDHAVGSAAKKVMKSLTNRRNFGL